MPSHQNNKGFGYLPVIAVSALVLTGLYFGYNWYNSQNSTNLKSDAPLEAAAPVSNNSEENLDVLAGNTPTFNPENKPVRWSFWNTNNTINISYWTGKDLNKLEQAMNKIKSTDFNILAVSPTNKPCFPSGAKYVSFTVRAEVEKVQPFNDFYKVTLKMPAEIQNEFKKVCGVTGATFAFIPGFQSDYVGPPTKQPKWDKVAPYSVLFWEELTAPSASLPSAAANSKTPASRSDRPASRSSAPVKPVGPQINLDGLTPDRNN